MSAHSQNKNGPRPLPSSAQALADMVLGTTREIGRDINALVLSDGRNQQTRMALERAVNHRAEVLHALREKNPKRADELVQTIKQGGVK
ncbi:MAG: hypothetical protein COV91_02675 [Candidatus Taylorbacteria bacterium CG11_big_fil_rev_8_21_14_0_20_46_11]|uniref:Uncharacterized protein n=1 Tax=Candidatus Taylorbacteria bacterium CG11_big_fil_rev_8_21_14_0_20_46_11 TaxID=1975025 RepID=A0A2H0KDM3_9BACT|nr:MAG: hypothetical protein COV91_02675 [Candidatus Taylorbacteria bacterium CG11_big_fil_rev_8_21_14_0_20_46_11]